MKVWMDGWMWKPRLESKTFGAECALGSDMEYFEREEQRLSWAEECDLLSDWETALGRRGRLGWADFEEAQAMGLQTSSLHLTDSKPDLLKSSFTKQGLRGWLYFQDKSPWLGSGKQGMPEQIQKGGGRALKLGLFIFRALMKS